MSTYISAKLPKEQWEKMCRLIQEFIDCFPWEYTEIPGLRRELVEHKLLIKLGFRPYKQLTRNYNTKLYDRIKEEVDWLLKVEFIMPCRYVEWVLNIIPVEKKEYWKN
jgi:hypothetical protein